ncbi:MAG: hypothetical protein ABSD31_11770 [Candidatus Binataceae bacterium]|jgi:NADPH-dependent glutamate synthase beta subunit-like oxidoreductase
MVATENWGPRHIVAVVGGATAGSEIARLLAERGVLVIVIEQNPRPYGKIEDGLPRWHVNQRKDEYEETNHRLDNPNVFFLPLTRLGRDIGFRELIDVWRPSALVLAHGAWRDRRFPVDGADKYVDCGLIYQNSLIYWFNHYPEAGYKGPHYELCPGALVIGGGLASIDVVKILQIEMTLKELAARGIKEEMVRIEREGIEPVLAKYGLKWADLAIKPCKLFYRRRIIDMPLSDIPPNATPQRAEALRQARGKILDKAQRKFLFEFQDQRVPTGLIVENDRLVGLKLSRTEVADGQVRTVPNSEEEVRGGLTISSIGSIPVPMPGIPQRGEVYDYIDQKTGLLLDDPILVFAAGNVLTGKGNIKDSLESGSEIGGLLAERYLGLSGERIALGERMRHRTTEQGEAIADAIAHRPPLSESEVAELIRRVRERQRAVGYDGNYHSWIAKVTPPDLQ